MKKPGIACCAAAALMAHTMAGCAGNPTEAPDESGETPEEVVTSSGSASDRVCRTERGTGTHIARTVCFTKAEQKAMSEDSGDWLRSRGSKGSPVPVRDTADPRDK